MSGNKLFVASALYTLGYTAEVSEYDATTGALIKVNFITGLDEPYGLAAFGNNLFVANAGTSTVGEYDAFTGAVVKANFITGLTHLEGLTVSGNNLFVPNFYSGTVNKYDATTGALITAVGLNRYAVSGSAMSEE